MTGRMTVGKAKRLLAFLTLVGAAFISGQRAVPLLVDQCDRGTRLESAPIVIVGVLTSDTLVGGPVPMHSDAATSLQLRRLYVRVENILRGAPIPAEITVYYFTWAGGFDGPRPLGIWRIGGRRILG